MKKIVVVLIVIIIAAGSVVGTLFFLNNNGDNDGQDDQPEAVLEILSLSVDRHNQFTGKEINVSVEVQNIGEAHGDLPVNMTIDGQNFSIANYNYMGPGEKKIITKPIIMLEEKNYSLCAGNYSEVCKFWNKYKVGMYFKYHYWTNDSDPYFGDSHNEGEYSVTIVEMSNTTLTLRWNLTSSDEVLIETVEKGSYLFLFKNFTHMFPPIYSGSVNASYLSEQLLCDRYVMYNDVWATGEIWARHEFALKFFIYFNAHDSFYEQLIDTNAKYMTIDEVFY